MTKLYVIVSPNFFEKTVMIEEFLNKSEKNLQIIDEYAISKCQVLEGVPKNDNYRYGLISVMARSHLLMNRDVIVFCDNLSIEALVLWKKMTVDHGSKCIIVLCDGDQESSMERINNLNVSEPSKFQMRDTINNQFKKYDDIHEILSNKMNTINRDLADEIMTEEEFSKSQEE